MVTTPAFKGKRGLCLPTDIALRPFVRLTKPQTMATLLEIAEIVLSSPGSARLHRLCRDIERLGLTDLEMVAAQLISGRGIGKADAQRLSQQIGVEVPIETLPWNVIWTQKKNHEPPAVALRLLVTSLRSPSLQRILTELSTSSITRQPSSTPPSSKIEGLEPLEESITAVRVVKKSHQNSPSKRSGSDQSSRRLSKRRKPNTNRVSNIQCDYFLNRPDGYDKPAIKYWSSVFQNPGSCYERISKAPFDKLTVEDLPGDWFINLFQEPEPYPIILQRKTPNRQTLGPKGLGADYPEFDMSSLASALNQATGHVTLTDVRSQLDHQVPTHLFLNELNMRAKDGRPFTLLSHEVSHTPFGSRLTPPVAFIKYDWASRFDPQGAQLRFVQVASAGAVTLPHIDFTASTVFLYVNSGRKCLLFAESSSSNLDICLSAIRQDDNKFNFRGDLYSVDLAAGESMIMPGGSIHCVYTSKDAICFSANMLTDYNIPRQLDMFRREQATRKTDPACQSFPNFTWLAYRALQDLGTRLSVDKPDLALPTLNDIAELIVFIEQECSAGDLAKNPGTVECERTCVELRAQLAFRGYTFQD